jgi:hypothetical protein
LGNCFFDQFSGCILSALTAEAYAKYLQLQILLQCVPLNDISEAWICQLSKGIYHPKVLYKQHVTEFTNYDVAMEEQT